MKTTDSQSLERFAAISQIYRWCQIYETEQNEKRLQNVLQIISDDFILDNVDGKWKGKERYLTRLSQMKTWRNANHIKKIAFAGQRVGEIEVNVESVYQTVIGDNPCQSHNVAFNLRLKGTRHNMPQIVAIKVDPVQRHDMLPFISTQLKNRVASFLYYVLFSMGTNPERIKYLLLPGCELQAGGKDYSWDRYASWAGSHHPPFARLNFNLEDVEIREMQDRVFVGVNFFDNKDFAANHAYELVNNQDDPYLWIKTLKVSLKDETQK